MKLSDTERTVLRALRSEYDIYSAYSYIHFAAIAAKTDLDRKVIRRACRSLARKGLAGYGRGLFTEDGTMYGAGYALTEAGLNALEVDDE